MQVQGVSVIPVQTARRESFVLYMDKIVYACGGLSLITATIQGVYRQVWTRIFTTRLQLEFIYTYYTKTAD